VYNFFIFYFFDKKIVYKLTSDFIT